MFLVIWSHSHVVYCRNSKTINHKAETIYGPLMKLVKSMADVSIVTHANYSRSCFSYSSQNLQYYLKLG